MHHIADWLEKLGMSEYAQRFAENRIDFSVLPDLTDQHLKDLGIRWRWSAGRVMATWSTLCSSVSQCRGGPLGLGIDLVLAGLHDRPPVAALCRGVDRHWGHGRCSRHCRSNSYASASTLI